MGTVIVESLYLASQAVQHTACTVTRNGKSQCGGDCSRCGGHLPLEILRKTAAEMRYE